MKKFCLAAAIVILTFSFIAGNGIAQMNETVGGDMGTYRIHCNVDGAQVYFDADYKGEIVDGLLDVPVYVTGTPYQSYRVEKDGYRSYTGGINSVPAKDQVINIYVTLSALPPVAVGTIHLLATPTLSTVYLDGTQAGIVPPNGVLVIRNVIVGNHAIEVSKEGFAPATLEVYVGENDILKVPVTLEPITSGPVSVSSNPPGAQVFIDGEFIGMTPVTVQNVSDGSHTFLLQLEGFLDYSESVVVTAEGTSISANLVAASLPTGKAGLSSLGLFSALVGCAFLFRRRP